MPLSWLKEFTEFKIPIGELAVKLSEAGLTIEKWEEKEGDTILDPEVTPNRPDLLCAYGTAREIAAVINTKLKAHSDEKKTFSHDYKTRGIPMEIKIINNFALCPRCTAIIVKGVVVKPSPDWLQKRLKQVGLRPINNLVDITNYVMWELGNPLHVFDYDKIRGKKMVVEEARGGEDFRSLDGINYKLPKDAIIIKDLGRVIDLCGIKGGENTAVSQTTRNILLHVPIYNGTRVRRTSQALGLRSDASAIFERGADPGGTVKALYRALQLVLDLGGGTVGSDLIDIKKDEFRPWTVSVSHEQIENLLCIKIDPQGVKEIFKRLELEALEANGVYEVTVPTFRNDLHIPEDLIEEVGRLYGYNRFPKTLPAGVVPIEKVAYSYDTGLDFRVKEILKGAGFGEIYSYSLISADQLVKLGIDPREALKIQNPISHEYEYLRPDLLGNLLEALKTNLPNFTDIKVFELGRIYQGRSLDKYEERYQLAGILNGERFSEAKGIIELIFNDLGIDSQILPAEEANNAWFHPARTAKIPMPKEKNLGYIAELHPNLLTKFGIKGRAVYWELDFDLLKSLAGKVKTYQPITKYPAIIEDLTLAIPDKVLVGDVLDTIKISSKLVNTVKLIASHEENKTFRINYLNPTKNLADAEVAKIRAKILANLKGEFQIKPKEK